MSNALLDVMNSCLNVPYVWGGNHPLEGLDCSGFVLWCLKSIGLWTGQDSNSQMIYNHFKVTGTVMKDDDDFPLGTLLFFGKSKTAITHIALANCGELMYEAGGGDSACLTFADAKKKGACVRIRPITNRRDLVAAIYPGRLVS